MNETDAATRVQALATKHANTGPTANQEIFSLWLLETTGYVCKTAREREAFLTAAAIADRAYALFQAAKPTSTRYVAPEPPARKPRSRKAAAK